MSIEFRNSPLNEVVLGMQFNGATFSSNNIIDIIEIFNKEFPEISENPPLPSIVESPTMPRIERFLNSFFSRKFIIHRNKNKLIQVQLDRLLFNWRKEDAKLDYPRFENVYSDFENIYDKINSELELQITSKINQYEFTYVDHIYLDSFDLESYTLKKVLNILDKISNIKDLNIAYSIPKEELGGVLTTSIKSAKSKKDNRKLFVLENTCRGFDPTITMDDWFAKAHKNLLDNFINIITDEAKKVWEFEE